MLRESPSCPCRACSRPAAAAGGSDGAAETGGEVKDVLNFSNWELYIDTPETRKTAGLTGPTTLEQFTEKRDQGQLLRGHQRQSGVLRHRAGPAAAGHGIGRDIIVSTDNDRYLSDYITNDWALKLDKSLIPNMSNLIEAQASPPFDPNREYSLPWFSGMDGIAWNENVTGPVTSVKQLFEDPDLKGKVGVWGQMGDTLGLIMLSNGDDPAKVTDESFARAIETLETAVTPVRSASSTATTTRSRSRGATWRPAWRGPATSRISATRS